MDLLKVNLNLTEQLEDTIEWNRIANGGIFVFSDKIQTLQHACLAEEVSELEAAIEDSDPVEVVDAICDTLFVAVYAWYMRTCGHTRISMVCENVGCVSTNYTLKNLLYDLQNCLTQCHYLEICKLIIASSVMFDFDLKDTYRHVVESNMTKFPKLGEINVAEEINWFIRYSKYTNVVCRLVNDEYYVFRENLGNGKVVKPRCFQEPALGWYLRGVTLNKTILELTVG